MSNELATTNDKVSAEVMEQVIATGDLSKLTAKQRVEYYRAVCDSVGLNWATQPFQYITLNGKLTLYARKDCTDQLRDSRHVSVIRLERERVDGIYVVTATAQAMDGRQDSSIGAVNVEGLKGEALANAMMKAETKAKRRVTLSICGLGWTDESEIETIPNARPTVVDMETGVIVETPKATVTVVTPGNGHETRTRQPWVSIPASVDEFIAASCERYSLSRDTVLEAMRVVNAEDFIGTKADAKSDIEAWLKENVTAIETEPEPLTLQM